MEYQQPIPYASPEAKPASKVTAAGLILLAAVALIVLGGCFLIGVMLIVTGGWAANVPPPSLPSSAIVLMGTLYLLAFASFIGSVVLLVIGIGGLFRVLRN